VRRGFSAIFHGRKLLVKCERVTLLLKRARQKVYRISDRKFRWLFLKDIPIRGKKPFVDRTNRKVAVRTFTPAMFRCADCRKALPVPYQY
jgi:hypothetical protein